MGNLFGKGSITDLRGREKKIAAAVIGGPLLGPLTMAGDLFKPSTDTATEETTTKVEPASWESLGPGAESIWADWFTNVYGGYGPGLEKKMGLNNDHLEAAANQYLNQTGLADAQYGHEMGRTRQAYKDNTLGVSLEGENKGNIYRNQLIKSGLDRDDYLEDLTGKYDTIDTLSDQSQTDFDQGLTDISGQYQANQDIYDDELRGYGDEYSSSQDRYDNALEGFGNQYQASQDQFDNSIGNINSALATNTKKLSSPAFNLSFGGNKMGGFIPRGNSTLLSSLTDSANVQGVNANNLFSGQQSSIGNQAGLARDTYTTQQDNIGNRVGLSDDRYTTQQGTLDTNKGILGDIYDSQQTSIGNKGLIADAIYGKQTTNAMNDEIRAGNIYDTFMGENATDQNNLNTFYQNDMAQAGNENQMAHNAAQNKLTNANEFTPYKDLVDYMNMLTPLMSSFQQLRYGLPQTETNQTATAPGPSFFEKWADPVFKTIQGGATIAGAL